MKLTRDQILILAKKEPESLADYVLALQDQVSFLTDQVTTLTGQVRQLTAEVAELKSRMNKNSQNSSKPPSSDGFKKPKPKSLRKKSKRKPGGQPGHTGHTLELTDYPDQSLVLPLDHCSCHHFLGDQPVINHEYRQVFELPKPKLARERHCTRPIRRKSEIVSTLSPPPAFYPRGQNQPIVPGPFRVFGQPRCPVCRNPKVLFQSDRFRNRSNRTTKSRTGS